MTPRAKLESASFSGQTVEKESLRLGAPERQSKRRSIDCAKADRRPHARSIHPLRFRLCGFWKSASNSGEEAPRQREPEAVVHKPFSRRIRSRREGIACISAGPDRASLPKDLLLERDHLVGSLSGQATLARAGIRTRAYLRQFNEAPPVRDGRRGSDARSVGLTPPAGTACGRWSCGGPQAGGARGGALPDGQPGLPFSRNAKMAHRTGRFRQLARPYRMICCIP
jgi:hypothetical protein